MPRSFYCLALLLILPAALAPAADSLALPAAPLVTGELLADQTAVRPSTPLTLGIRLTMASGWHIYWKNPGDAGEAPAFHFQLPPGYQIGEVQYPLPVKFEQPGGLIAYGYPDTVMLTATVTPPAQLPAGDQTFHITLDWMCCKDICKVGTTKLALTLPVGAPAAANQDAFRQAAAAMPAVAPPAAVAVVGPIEAVGPLDNGTQNYRFTIDWKTTPDHIDLFPAPVDGLDVRDLRATSDGQHTRISLQAHRMQGQRLAGDTLPLLVAYSQAGRRHGFYTSVHLQALQKIKP